jgi:dTDP-4-amino-4,6-dideoxygalactose transaminase
MSVQSVPFFRPQMTEAEIGEVCDTLRSGWLTTGPKTKRFEEAFAETVGAKHAVALNSCTAALHLAVEALGLQRGQVVLVPAMTFAATAEVVRYCGAIPLLVDCDAKALNLDLEDAERKIEHLRLGLLPRALPPDAEVVGIIPVHVGGLMMNVDAVKNFAERHGLWVVEDAAHSFPAAWRKHQNAEWQRCGERTADVTCFSFYANKTITTGEGGMATTDDAQLAARMRSMSLHGLSHDAWGRYSGGGSWDYQIIAPGFKYNITDLASSIGLHQLARAEEMRRKREGMARRYAEAFARVEELELPAADANRVHSWHLYPVKLRLDRLRVSRNAFIEELKQRGVGCSVHWRPLHLHPYYREQFGWQPGHLPTASAAFERTISLPIFSGMREEEFSYVCETVLDICARHSRHAAKAKHAQPHASAAANPTGQA